MIEQARDPTKLNPDSARRWPPSQYPSSGGGTDTTSMGAAGACTEELQVHLLDGARNGPEGMADPSEASRRRGRTRGVRLCGCLRWAKHELLGFGALLVTGVVLGVALPKDAKLTDPAVATVSNVLGWTYFLAWTISFYPQVRPF